MASHDYPIMILLVDDQSMVFEAVRRALVDQPDMDLHYCSDSREAVAVATRIKPTIILQDLIMPGPDGMRLLQEYRANPSLRDIPVLVLTTKEDPLVKAQAFSVGANDYIVKLPDRIELAARIRHHARVYTTQLQKDAAYRAVRDSQQQLLEANATLATANQKLGEATHAKSAFLANTTHDLRDPMNAVLGYASMLLETELTEEQREYALTVRKSADSLLNIVNGVLDLSKIEAGKIVLEAHPFELHTCLEETLDLIAPKAAEKNLDLAYNIDDTVPRTLIGDVTRLRQILTNLAGNAVKFTHRGEVIIEVSTSGQTSAPAPMRGGDTEFLRQQDLWRLHFTVRDTGIGIPLEKQPRLFRAFEQVDSSTTRQYGGTGLGLVICKQLVQLMGGDIWVDSEAGQGSAFHFTIVTKSVPDAPPLPWQTVQPQLAGKRLLVVEDNATNCAMIARRAAQWGMHVECASSIGQATAIVNSGRTFNACILDLQLPEEDLQDLAAELLTKPNRAPLPVLLLCTPKVKREEDLRRGLLRDLPAIPKPIRPGQLLESISRTLSLQSSPRKRPQKDQPETKLGERLPLAVLLADDNPINQKVGQSALQKLGYKADLAGNGFEVLQAMELRAYDIVFMDVQMPEMDGLETARQICKNWPKEQRPAIIAMTGYAFASDRDKCTAAGMDDHICKPIRIADLQTALETWGAKRPVSRPAPPVEDPAPASSEELLDFAVIEEVRQMPSSSEESMFNELVDLYLQTAPERMAAIRKVLSDGEKLAFAAHALKSMSLHLGAKKVVSLAARLEQAGRSGDLEQAPALLRDLEAVLARTRIRLLSCKEKGP